MELIDTEFLFSSEKENDIWSLSSCTELYNNLKLQLVTSARTIVAS